MRYRHAGSQGSFIGWGIGFRFRYEAHHSRLAIAPISEKRVIAQQKLDRHLARIPLAYVRILDKTNQIKALIYSNNTTINLAETLERKHLISILDNTLTVSKLAFELEHQNFRRFSKHFCKRFNLQALKIKSFTSRESATGHVFLAKIKTGRGNAISAHASTLSGLMSALSDKVLKDLLTMEFGYNYNAHAYSLMQAASKLATISYILDHSFSPRKKLSRSRETTTDSATGTTLFSSMQLLESGRQETLL